MAEGWEIYDVSLTERQIARITSVLAKHSGGSAAAAGDKTILEMLHLAKRKDDGSPPMVSLFQCDAVTAVGLMRACINKLEALAQTDGLDVRRNTMYQNVFSAAQTYLMGEFTLIAQQKRGE